MLNKKTNKIAFKVYLMFFINYGYLKNILERFPLLVNKMLSNRITKMLILLCYANIIKFNSF